MNKLIRNAIIGTSAFVIAMTSLYKLDQTEQAVVSTFGKPTKVLLNPIEPDKALRDSAIQQTTIDIANYANSQNVPVPKISSSGAGLKAKWPWQHVTYIDRRMMEWDGFPEQVPTKDKKYLYVDGTARWIVTNPFIFFSALGGEVENAHSKLDDVVDGAVREQISKRDAIESIRSTNRKMLVLDKELEQTATVDSIYDGREHIAGIIKGQVDNQCSRYGISVEDFLFKRLVYVDEVKKSVEDRMRSERNRISQKYRSEGEGEYARIMGEKTRQLNEILSGAYKQSEEIKGRGDAQATKIYNEAFSIDPEFYAFYKSLEVMKENVKGANLVLDKNNQLFQYVNGRK